MSVAATSHSQWRVSPAVRRIAIAAFIVLLPFGLHALWDYIEIRRLVREIELIRAKGEPVTPQQAGRGYQPLTEEQERASRYYLAAAALPDPRWNYHDADAELQQWLAGVSPAPPKELLIERLRRRVERTRDALGLLDTATTLDFKTFAPGTSYSYRTSHLWTLSQVNAARTAYLSLTGDGDKATESALAGLKLRRLERNAWWSLNPCACGVSVVLALSRPSVEALRRLEQALEVEDHPDEVYETILVQRAQFLDEIWRQYYGSDPSAPRTYTLPMRSVTETLSRPWFSRQLVVLLQAQAELLDAARKPWPEKAQAIARVRDKYLSERKRPALFAGLLRLNFYIPGQAAVSGSLIDERASRTAVAVERFRHDHAGALPQTLQHLVPAYLAALPVDPFSGRSLLYRYDAEAYTIYSIGSDLQDEGGDLTSELRRDLKRGWGPKRLKGRDEGVRILIH